MADPNPVVFFDITLGGERLSVLEIRGASCLPGRPPWHPSSLACHHHLATDICCFINSTFLFHMLGLELTKLSRGAPWAAQGLLPIRASLLVLF
jgi:hypothetical protein